MEQIEKQYFKEPGELDAVDYFHFIMKEGYRLSLIDSAQLEKLQYQILRLLTDQFNRYTGGQSSSVPVETGQSIQQSVFYTIGYYLKSLPNTKSGLDSFIKYPLSELYLHGKELIETDQEAANELLRSLQKDCLATDVYAYNDTLHEGLAMFFTSYDIDYGAHETPASIDYPLSNDKMNLSGIDYIYGYLQKLQLENEFCGHFSDEEIHHLMRGYDHHYKGLLFNIYDLILTNTLGCLMLGRDDLKLQISDYDRQYLQHELSMLPKEKIDNLVDGSLFNLCKRIPVSNPRLEKYLKASAINLKFRLRSALEINGLQHLFLSLDDEIDTPLIQFEGTNKLDDESFRILADEIRECRFASDKIKLLSRDSLSITDLVDLLEGDCFYGKEFHDIFRSLEDIRLALLTKMLPYDPSDSSLLLEEDGKEWHGSLDSFLNQIQPERKTAIKKLAALIEITS